MDKLILAFMWQKKMNNDDQVSLGKKIGNMPY